LHVHIQVEFHGADIDRPAAGVAKSIVISSRQTAGRPGVIEIDGETIGGARRERRASHVQGRVTC